MNFLEFRNNLSPYPVFSLRDVLKTIPDFHRIQLDRWKKKGYIKKIKRGLYCFEDYDQNQNFLFYSANKIHSPSYISLETALKHYGLIPEEIFQITSLSTKKTETFKTPIGNFNYHHIKPDLYWGYRLVDFRHSKIRMAEPEKAILDYLYFHPSLKTTDDFNSIRINRDEWRMGINPEKLKTYLAAFHNKQLVKRATVFLKTLLK